MNTTSGAYFTEAGSWETVHLSTFIVRDDINPINGDKPVEPVPVLYISSWHSYK